MVCQFEPQSAQEILRTSRSIQLDEALPSWPQFLMIDACVSISPMLRDFEAVVSLVAEELEQELIEVLEFGNEVIGMSIDPTGDDPNMQKPLQIVQIMFDLLFNFWHKPLVLFNFQTFSPKIIEIQIPKNPSRCFL
jgi:hypothetical protein